MRFILSLTLLLMSSLVAFAQKDVTTFLGIPIDGYKSEMKQKLISKGFTYDAQNDCFEGEFNGEEVVISIVTNNNKVYRIAVFDKISRDETNIRIRFNNLCNQFTNNKKYASSNFGQESYLIPDDEDISYNMGIKNKRYQASYYQVPIPELMDTLAIQNKFREKLLQKYTEDQITNPTEEQSKEMQAIIQEESLKLMMEMVSSKSVWFMINDRGVGEYNILMYYDNKYNEANGEDL